MHLRQSPIRYIPDELLEKLRIEPIAEQFTRDGQVWKEFLTTDKYADDKDYRIKQEIMMRIFTFIYINMMSDGCCNNILYLGNSAVESLPLGSPPLAVASILSHGGRITFQVEKANWDNFLQAMFGHRLEKLYKKGIIIKRFSSSHDITSDNEAVSYDPKTAAGKGKILLAAITKYQLAMNLGLGLNDDGGANAEKTDGCHGQLFILIKQPEKDNPGVISIGVETSGYRQKNIFGATHDGNANAGEFSPTGGLKFKNECFSNYMNAGHVLQDRVGLKVILPNDAVLANEVCLMVNARYKKIINHLSDPLIINPYYDASPIPTFPFPSMSNRMESASMSSNAESSEGGLSRHASLIGSESSDGWLSRRASVIGSESSEDRSSHCASLRESEFSDRKPSRPATQPRPSRPARPFGYSSDSFSLISSIDTSSSTSTSSAGHLYPSPIVFFKSAEEVPVINTDVISNTSELQPPPRPNGFYSQQITNKGRK